jgi:hypothetical protein
MPRTARLAPAGVVFHVLNRAKVPDTFFAHWRPSGACAGLGLEIPYERTVRARCPIPACSFLPLIEGLWKRTGEGVRFRHNRGRSTANN